MDVAIIEAKDAVIYWNRSAKDHPVETVYIDRPSYRGGKRIPTGCANAGAIESNWKEMTDAERTSLLRDMALEMMASLRYDPVTVMREFCKIRQFYELGAKSYPMRRAISSVTYGSAREDWPPGSNENGPF